MEIKLFGEKTIFLKGKKENVLINPSNKGLEGKINARVIIYSDEDLGQLEVNGIGIKEGGTIYVVTVDGFRLVVIGDLSEELSEKKIDKVDEADIMLTTAKIGDKVNFKLLRDWAKKWGVNYMIPLLADAEAMKHFLDEADEEGLTENESLKLDKIDDLPDGFEVKLLKKN